MNFVLSTAVILIWVGLMLCHGLLCSNFHTPPLVSGGCCLLLNLLSLSFFLAPASCNPQGNPDLVNSRVLCDGHHHPRAHPHMNFVLSTAVILIWVGLMLCYGLLCSNFHTALLLFQVGVVCFSTFCLCLFHWHQLHIIHEATLIW